MVWCGGHGSYFFTVFTSWLNLQPQTQLTNDFHFSLREYSYASNEHHKWLKKRDWPTVEGAIPTKICSGESTRREMSMDDCHIIGLQRKLRHTHMLLPLYNDSKTPIDIARRSGACAEIIGLLSLTPEEADSLGGKEMFRLYAPVAYWRDGMAGWIRSQSHADCHKWIMSTMTSWCVKCSNTAILIFF